MGLVIERLGFVTSQITRPLDNSLLGIDPGSVIDSSLHGSAGWLHKSSATSEVLQYQHSLFLSINHF